MVEKNFKAIEGLRGYLALWVAVGHAMQLAGYLDPPGPLKIVMQGGAAVEVFMIVSGFVISHLILVKGERYDAYIVRRFFRLYPCFLICCAIGFLSLPLWSSVVHQFHWSASGWPTYVAGVDALQHETSENFRAHAILHALMLHGAVPAEVLPKAPMTFLPAAWSISLEWQFYIVAPAVLALTKGAGRLAALVFIALGAHVLYLKGVFGSFEVESHIAGSMGLFAIGIVSRLALENLRAMRLNPLNWTLITFALSVILFKQFLAVAVWLPFYGYIVWGGDANRSERFFDFLFSNTATTIKVHLF